MRYKIALLSIAILLSSTATVVNPTGQSVTVETVESGASSPSVDRVDNETWLVPTEAVPVYVTGTTPREDGTVVVIEVVHGGETIRIGEAEADDGNWNATVDFRDVSTGTHTLRVADGAATTAVRIELVHVLRPPSVTPTDTTERSTAEATESEVPTEYVATAARPAETETIQEIVVGAGVVSVTERDDGYEIVVSVGFYWTFGDDGSAQPTGIADGRPYEATYFVPETTTNRLGDTL